MENLPLYISIVLFLTTFLAILIFYRATTRSLAFLIIAAGWLLVQAVLSLNGFYKVVNTLPPRFLLLIAPPLLGVALLFITPAGRKFIDNLNLRTLTLLHLIRIPVELVLYWLFLNRAIPQLITFEGRNFDVFSGVSAPIIYYFAFAGRNINRNLLLLWNVLCLLLLVNVVVYAILSAPSPFQQFAFDQPNIAISYFPFVWLPACIVPLVLLSHLSALRQLLRARTKKPL